ncbi:MarR family winged helix-turn-helix transcriptional regulator [Marinactinospora thermotolerans]|uniref:Transcriptional regulator, MarR family n=1 Tax=Marinactinospora thermotolerans DSM 45154 TaxID=1122192 RepID=A0A1T4TEL3_9ACTN|nr:MarR family transcriptional regulator [Marinactinospora thermotolerans]SKA38678.1 transcriptional regulator, MarR family [Marinactinospora thermotolerans DSM 45154]
MGEAVPGRDPLSLDGQLCFAVYAASRAMTGLYRDLLADLDLTYPQYLVMLALWERGTASVGDLGEALRLDSGTLSPLLRRLEARGLVRRRRDTGDERVVRVTLTQTGTALRERARPIPGRVLCATGLTEDEVAGLRGLLDQLTESVATHDPTSVGRPSTPER